MLSNNNGCNLMMLYVNRSIAMGYCCIDIDLSITRNQQLCSARSQVCLTAEGMNVQHSHPCCTTCCQQRICNQVLADQQDNLQFMNRAENVHNAIPEDILVYFTQHWLPNHVGSATSNGELIAAPGSLSSIKSHLSSEFELLGRTGE